MNRNILITGPVESGKTRLAKLIGGAGAVILTEYPSSRFLLAEYYDKPLPKAIILDDAYLKGADLVCIKAMAGEEQWLVEAKGREPKVVDRAGTMLIVVARADWRWQERAWTQRLFETFRLEGDDECQD